MVIPCEDVINAFLKFFVDPLLPSRPSRLPQAPSQSEKESLPKQMHAVVLLYNYYHMKLYPESEYVGFEKFCKLAVTLRPSLKLHMKFTHSKSSSADNSKNEDCLSETEKAILDAINISLVLNPTKDNPNTEKWTVSKVAVLVVDSVKQKCIVLYNYLTKWVWSIIEKDVADVTSEGKRVGKRVYKRKGSNRKTDDDADRFQQFAFAAVKEATGISEADLKILESHVVYSLSKEKSCTRFYIVQYTQSNHDIRFPLKDLIDGFQGPLVKQSSGNCMATSVVKYYDMLPYAAILSDWFSRQEVNSNNLQVEKEERAAEEEEVGESKQVLTNTRQNQNTGPDFDNSGSFCSRKKDDGSERMFIDKNSNNYQKRKSFSTEKTDINFLTTSVDPEGEESKMKQIVSERRYNKDFDKKLPHSALEVLIKKRKYLSDQLCTLEDEVAVCDQTIKTILDGGEISTALSLQVVIDCCNEGQDRNDCLSLDFKPNTSCTAILSSKTPCQELDEISKENNWTFPNYIVRASDGGFLAKVKLKGIDFKLSAESDTRSMPEEARESAAEKILAKLRH